ncbi:hypothetical protein [Alkalimonas mucilaginosa]|uniref:Uncharacterized protein n=1 Tax=Alkalimonas mucilaginosa TaxID=3057676 RepID=A0ABU7JHA2_9GAMM|nr:hypothetical protein [Alkalimonas sp. MEB004]MEE2025027.1 hypothetical protein [Alkalimonas sp. MEB004]
MIIDTITMPDMPWVNEYSWSSRVANTQYASSGALMVEVAQRQAGRSIVLQEDLITRELVNALVTHAEETPGEFQITLGDGRTFTVMWDYSNQPVAATPLQDEVDPDNDSYLMAVTLRFITV